MQQRSLRTFGAMVVLVVIGGMALFQLWPRTEDPGINEVVPEATSNPTNSVAGPVVDGVFTYRVGLLSGVSTDNFWAFYGREASVWNAYVLGPTKPALFSVDSQTGSLQPEIASDNIKAELDGDTWRVYVTLDESHSWSDGRPITANDIVYTFDTVRTLGLDGSWRAAFPDTIAAMTAPSVFELVIEFTERPTLSVWPHGVGLAPIMPAHIWRDVSEGSTPDVLYSASGASDVGGGPMAILSITEDEIVSGANPGYPSTDHPDEVIYKVFSNEADAVAALGAGEVDTILTPHGLTHDSSRLAGTYPAVSVDVNPANAVRYLGFNMTKAPMSDPAFRTAVATLLDRRGAAAEITGFSTPAFTFVNPANPQWFNPEAHREIASLFEGELHDRLDSVLGMLEGAGYDWDTRPTLGEGGEFIPGRGLTVNGDSPDPLTILTPGDEYDPDRPRYATEIASIINWLGFDVVPIETDFDSVVDLAFTPDEEGAWQYDMYLLGWTLGSPALPDYYRHLFGADGELNNTGYNSDVFAEQLSRYESAYTYEEAYEALWAMEATLAADLPYLLLYTRPISEAYRSDRVAYSINTSLGGLQGRLGGLGDVAPTG